MPVRPELVADQAELTAWRRDFHRHPELGYQEVRTSNLVAERLAAWGIKVHRGIGKTGVVGVLHGRRDGARAIALRADMDALPMTEENTFEHASATPGVFHGCGHDGHTTMLLGAAQHLARTRDFAGTVYFVFQPAEEGLAGGKAMVDDGLFERFPCDEVYGMHNWPQEPLGVVVARSGPMMAASDLFDIEVEGVGGHAAMPQVTVDPIVIAAHIVTALQSLVARSVDPVDSAVVSVTSIEAGSTYNVIPRVAQLRGTARTFKPATRDLVEAGIARIATHVAAAFGAVARVDYRRNYPATINSERETLYAQASAARVVGAENVVSDRDPCMGGEDFAFMLEERPGSYVWLGQGGGPSACNVHHPRYDFNDALLPIGASYWVELVESRLV
ncbi:MAG: M20 aminoacylase family protein [Planctomycetota bacterium]